MAPYQTSAPANQPRLVKTNILGLILFLLGAPNIFGFLNASPQDAENTMIPRFVTLVLTAGALASVIEWLVQRGAGLA